MIVSNRHSFGNNTGEEIAVLGTGTQHTFTRNYLYNAIQNIEFKAAGWELQFEGCRWTKENHFLQWGLVT
ncbi:MAG: hypothetical protein U0T36_03275 [Saprospiraceae bacterium]